MNFLITLLFLFQDRYRGNSGTMDDVPVGLNAWLFTHVVLPIVGLVILGMIYTEIFPPKVDKEEEEEWQKEKEEWQKEKVQRQKEEKKLSRWHTREIILNKKDLIFQDEKEKINQVSIVANKNTGEIVHYKDITDKDGNSREIGFLTIESKPLPQPSAYQGEASIRTAFVYVEKDAIELIISTQVEEGAPLPLAGKICIEEVLTPYYLDGHGNLQQPIFDPRTYNEITYHGEPVYQNIFFTLDANQADVFLGDTETDYGMF